MSEILNLEYQSMAANGICHAANMASIAWQSAASEHTRPSAVFKPALSIDGDQWCALYGSNLQDGVAGFWKSPADAMHAFDAEWEKKLP